MNRSHIFTGSLILNAVLLLAVLALAANRDGGNEPAPAPSVTEPAKSPDQAKQAAPAASQEAAHESGTEEAPKQFDWRLVESQDYRTYIENLRAIGCPEETIRDIIAADVRKLFAARRKEELVRTNRLEYWKADAFMNALADPDRLEKQHALANEEKRVLKSLLGDDVTVPMDASALLAPVHAMLDFLPEDKMNRALELEQEYSMKMAKLLGGGAPDEQEQEELRRIMADKEAALATVMTPEEARQYELRLSQTAMMLRMEMDGFNPTEEEFVGVYALKKEFDKEWGPFPFGADEERQQAQQALNEQIRETLGDERYETYERAQDHGYKAIAKVAERQGGGEDAAIRIWEMKKAAEEHASQIRMNEALNMDQRQAALQAIRAETEQAIMQEVGPEGFDSLKKGVGGMWMRGIAPDAPPAPAPVGE